MSRLSGLLLTFTAVVCILHQSVDARQFVLTGEIQCGLGGHQGFVKSIELIEAIPKSRKVEGDRLKQHVTVDQKASPVTYKIEGRANGRGDYTPYFQLKHTCTSDNSETTQYIEFSGEGTNKDDVFFQKQNIVAKKENKGRPHRKNEINPKIIVKGDEEEKKGEYKSCKCLHKVCSYHCMTK